MLLSAAAALAATVAAAQTAPALLGRPLSFEEARDQLERTSDTLAASRAGGRASQEQAASLRHLARPIVSLDAQALKYQKSLDIPLADAKAAVQQGAGGFLSNLPALLPDLPADLVSVIQAGLTTQIQGALAATPDSLRLQTRQTVVRPTATALMPLYTGGLITGVQGVARAGADQARAEAQVADDTATLQLIQTYFGQQLTARLLAVATETTATFEHHRDNARKLEAQGVIPKAARLQAEVAYNTAQRQELSAADAYQTATETLSLLLREEGPIAPTTPLFVDTHPLGPVQTYVDAGLANQPELKRLEALHQAGRAGVDVAKSALMPKAYAFAEYNFNRDDAIPTDPDWIIGVGAHYTLFSDIDRGAAVRSARAKADQAQAAIGAARDGVKTATFAAYRQVETARKQFLLLEANIVAARENLRVQELAFREGEATTSAVIDARTALSQAQTQRTATAYAYDLSLAQLLAVSGQIQTYGDHVARADKDLR